MTTTNLKSSKAAEKIKELAEAIDFTMLCTDLDSKPIHSIPMSTKRVDDDGSIWFLSGQDSTHNANIRNDSKVQLLYSDPASMRFLAVFGGAEIITDRLILNELYGSTDDAWFEGVDDPNLSAIKVSPLDAHYWDAKKNQLVTLLKIGMAAAVGSKPDIIEHGNLSV